MSFLTLLEELVVLVLQENNKIILGSNSPRRRELLSKITTNFEVISPNCDETLDDNMSITDAIIDVSRRKAFSIKSDEIVITADTLVVLNDKILGKPKDITDAFDTLKLLSDNTHQVFTAVTIKKADYIDSFITKSDVTFNHLSDEEIMNYINTGEPFDKAGSYGIQGVGGLFIKSICGDYYSIVGLPISTLYNKLKIF